MARFSPAAIRSAVGAFRKNTATGADLVGMTFLSELPDAALRGLQAVYTETAMKLALPAQQLVAMIALIPKKVAGWRSIAVCPSHYRVLMAMLAPSLREWDRQAVTMQGGAVDTAAPGVHASFEVARRQLRHEVASLQGLVTVQLLWDVQAFFDSIPLADLVEDAQLQGMPRDAGVLAMQMHTAARILKLPTTLSNPIDRMGTPILAGCTSSTSFARCHLRGPTSDAAVFDHVRVGQHVDDITQTLEHATPAGARDLAVEAGRAFCISAMAKGYTIADKSVVVSNRPGVAQAIAAELAHFGLHIEPATVTEDLGHTTSAGGARSMKFVKQRFSKAQARAGRVQRLAQQSKKASKLFATGVLPQATFGHAILGLAPHLRRRVRAMAAKCRGAAGVHPCSATLLQWRGGPTQDPMVELCVDQVGLWLQLWEQASMEERLGIIVAWRTARRQLEAVQASQRWCRVRGPLSATITVLLEFGWAPTLPQQWMAPGWTAEGGGQVATMSGDPSDRAHIVAEFRASVAQHTWEQAARHHNGAGLQEAPPLLRTSPAGAQDAVQEQVHRTGGSAAEGSGRRLHRRRALCNRRPPTLRAMWGNWGKRPTSLLALLPPQGTARRGRVHLKVAVVAHRGRGGLRDTPVPVGKSHPATHLVACRRPAIGSRGQMGGHWGHARHSAGERQCLL